MKGKNWSSFWFQLLDCYLFLCNTFSYQPLYFNFSLLQKELSIAHKQAMTLIHSTVAANDDVAMFTVVGANSGTVISESELNDNMQA